MPWGIGRFIRRAAGAVASSVVDTVVPGGIGDELANRAGRFIAGTSGPQQRAQARMMGGGGVPMAPAIPSLPAPPGGGGNGGMGGVVGGVVGGVAGGALAPYVGVPPTVGSATGTAIGREIGQQARRAHNIMFPDTMGGGGQTAFGPTVKQAIVYRSEDGRVRYGSDPGYVVVRRQSGGQLYIFQMERKSAIASGWWKPAKKPLISVRDSNALRRAGAVKKRLEKIAKDNDIYGKQKPRPRTRRTTQVRHHHHDKSDVR